MEDIGRDSGVGIRESSSSWELGGLCLAGRCDVDPWSVRFYVQVGAIVFAVIGASGQWTVGAVCRISGTLGVRAVSSVTRISVASRPRWSAVRSTLASTC